jgi:hypothetical protein
MRLRAWLREGGWYDVAGIAAVIFVVLWELQPRQWLSGSLLTGGDTASHLALPAYLRTQGNLFNLTPWYPGWFDGMPAYTYYFVLPDYLATLGSYLIGFAHAFKFATLLGSVLIPPAAYTMGRLFRAPRPVPLALAMATLPFLFDASYTIDGGNLFSTMAGEYAFSLSLAFALVTVGLFARGVRLGRGYWVTGFLLSLTLAAHLLPWLFCLAAVAVLVIDELVVRWRLGPDARDDVARPLRFAVGAGLISFGFSAWWLISFATTQQLTNSMGYVNDSTSTLRAIFTTLGWFTTTGAAGDRWVIALAAVGLVVAAVTRDRLGRVLAVLTVASLAAFVLDPQGVIWNERLVPFWFVTTHLLAGWVVGYVAYRWSARRVHARTPGVLSLGRLEVRLAHRATEDAADADADADDARRDQGVADADHEDDEVLAPTVEESGEYWPRSPRAVPRITMRMRRAAVAVIVLGLASTLPGLMPPVANALSLNTSGNQVWSWAQWNYSGYQGKTAWPEYRDLMTTMSKVAGRYGCGRAMWEYNSDQNRFGSPMALMLLPYWTDNCVGSMEGLFFESSPTVPYHFLDQSELSLSPSDPQLGLPYGGLDVAQGVQHLRMLGVRYYIAFSPEVIAQADRNPYLKLVARTRAWPAPGTRWYVYRILDSPVVEPLTTLPAVVSGISSRASWQAANVTWWTHNALWDVLGAASGPANWPRAHAINLMPHVAVTDPPVVSRVKVGDQMVSFHVSRVGTPILVKVSYYPRWHASGAQGPYRVSPNLMVVVPTSKDVTLTYGSSPPVIVGNLISDVTVVAALVVVVLALRRRRAARQ